MPAASTAEPLPPLYTRAFWTACAVHVTGGLSLAMFLLIPLLVRALGGSDLTIGLVLGVSTAFSVAARPLVGLMLDAAGRRPVLLAAGALNVLSWLPFLLLRTAGPGLFVCSIAHTVVWGALFAAYFTYAADLTPANRRAEGIAVFGVFGMAANGLGPALGESIIAGWGFPAFFLTAAGFGLVSLALTTLVPARPPALRAAEQPNQDADGGIGGEERTAAREPDVARERCHEEERGVDRHAEHERDREHERHAR